VGKVFIGFFAPLRRAVAETEPNRLDVRRLQ
jgi:hypothetical protein